MAQTTIDDDLFSDLESTLSATPATTVLDQVEVQLGLAGRTQKPPSAPQNVVATHRALSLLRSNYRRKVLGLRSIGALLFLEQEDD